MGDFDLISLQAARLEGGNSSGGPFAVLDTLQMNRLHSHWSSAFCRSWLCLWHHGRGWHLSC